MSEQNQFQTETVNHLLADYALLTAIFAGITAGRALTEQEQQMMVIMSRMHERLTKST